MVFAYETDGNGNGNQLFIDDANVPGLLSLPYLGCCAISDARYLRTRRRALSGDNLYCYQGKVAEGIGGPHTGRKMIWPIGIMMRALTSVDDTEIISRLRWLGALIIDLDRRKPNLLQRPPSTQRWRR